MGEALPVKADFEAAFADLTPMDADGFQVTEKTFPPCHFLVVVELFRNIVIRNECVLSGHMKPL